ncbi:MAG: rod shape-determining protein MreD [Peptococcaceae bacterium]|nr:rod shape-determining protein MreD [Peptococcaceae bacterium]
MSRFSLLFLVGIALILQSTVLHFVQVAGVKPDLILVLVVIHAILNGPRKGAFLGFMAGLLQDLLTGYFVGLNAISKALIGGLVGLGQYNIYKDNVLIIGVIGFGATLGAEAINYFLLLVLGVEIALREVLLRLLIPLGFYNAAVTVLVFRPYYHHISNKNMLRHL